MSLVTNVKISGFKGSAKAVTSWEIAKSPIMLPFLLQVVRKKRAISDAVIGKREDCTE